GQNSLHETMIIKDILDCIGLHKDNPLVMEIAAAKFREITKNFRDKPEAIKIIAIYISDNIEKYDGSTSNSEPVARVRGRQLLTHTVRFVFENYWSHDSTEEPPFVKLREYVKEQYRCHEGQAKDAYDDMKGRIYLRNFIAL